MTDQAEWKDEYEAELQRAEAARLAGNEAMARVCARRAAGIVIREFFTRRGSQNQSRSAHALLQSLQITPGLPSEVYQAAGRLLTRVTPEFTLPIQADLIQDTRRLAELLFSKIPQPY